jgi:hypothetical protein
MSKVMDSLSNKDVHTCHSLMGDGRWRRGLIGSLRGAIQYNSRIKIVFTNYSVHTLDFRDAWPGVGRTKSSRFRDDQGKGKM